MAKGLVDAVQARQSCEEQIRGGVVADVEGQPLYALLLEEGGCVDRRTRPVIDEDSADGDFAVLL